MTQQEQHPSFIHLKELMGGDLAIVNAAKVSYGKSSNEIAPSEIGLINRLMRDRHGSPFEAAVMQWYVKTPIVVAREWFRHRIGSFNEVSGRYKEFDFEVYVPKQFRVPAPERKQMDYKYRDAKPEVDAKAREILSRAYQASDDAYRELLDLGIAKEHARLIMPVGQYTEFIWTVNARAFMNFLSLRTHPTAMKEIRTYASGMEHVWGLQMPHTAKAFNENGRVAP